MSIKAYKNKNKNLGYALACFLPLMPAAASANAGVPMILVTMPAMLIGLIPIIAIESYILQKRLGLALKKSVTSSAISNAVSTLVGIPLTWIILVVIQLITGGDGAHGLQTFFQKFLAVTWQAPWLIPYESDLDWMIPAAMLVLLIPFFFVSWQIEYFIIRKLNKQLDRQAIKVVSLKANLITYALFTLYPLGLFTLSF